MKYTTMYMTIVTSMMVGAMIGLKTSTHGTFLNQHKGAGILLMVIVSMIAAQIITMVHNKNK